MKSLKWFFVLPEIQDIPSGGNLYNAQLIGALRSQNIELEVLDFTQYLQAREKNTPGLYWIDTLFLDKFGQLKKREEGPMIHGLIVHHLDSLYPPNGTDPDHWFAEKEAVLLARFEWFLATSPYTCKYLQIRGFNPERIIVAPPALSFKPQWRESKAEEIRALMVSNLVERKGVLPFLSGLAERYHELGPFNLTIVGSDEIEPEYAAACYEQVASHPGLQQSVHLTGSLLPRKTQRYYRFANLYVSSAYMETYGMSLQEARAFRLPILALEGGNTSFHVKEGGNGRIFPIFDDLLDFFQLLTTQPDLFQAFHNRALACESEDDYDWQEVAGRVLNALPSYSWKK